jgi:hypothetical protein
MATKLERLDSAGRSVMMMPPGLASEEQVSGRIFTSVTFLNFVADQNGS